MIGPVGLRTSGEDPSWIVPPTVVDEPVAASPVGKDRREDLQLLSFMWSLTVSGAQRSAWQVRLGEDPPDRVLTIGPSSWPLELTELTLQDLRGSLARTRALGRTLHEEVCRRTDDYAHLLGRQVAVSLSPEELAPRPDPAELVTQISAALTEDRGVVGDGLDLAQGLPERIPASAGGFYGEVAGCSTVQTYVGKPGEISVACLEQAEIRRSEVIRLLQTRITQKDTPANEVLLMTCGAPDDRGHVCPLDGFIFQFVADLASEGALRFDVSHLRNVVVHRWGSGDWLEIHRQPGAEAPWG